MKPSEASTQYEVVTKDIAQSVFRRFHGLPPTNVKTGRDSKWQGQSDFIHQIDVFIEGESDIIMVECKHWTRKKGIEAAHLLTFIARINDLRPNFAKTLHPVFITASRFQSGCTPLARFYGINLQHISSAGNFAFEYQGIASIGSSPSTGGLSIQGYVPINSIQPVVAPSGGLKLG